MAATGTTTMQLLRADNSLGIKAMQVSYFLSRLKIIIIPYSLFFFEDKLTRVYNYVNYTYYHCYIIHYITRDYIF